MRFGNLPSAVLVAMLTVTPAFASGATKLPEPDSLVLLSLGVAGLLIGRRFAARRDED